MREGPNLDFKLKLSLTSDGEKKELTRDVIAIANSKGGRGYLIFGVQDKTKKVFGIDPADFNEEKIQQIIYNRCDPPIPVTVDIINIYGKHVAVMTIFRSNHKPHQMIRNGAFYIRRGSTTDVARRNEIASMFQQNGVLTYETVVLKNASKDTLDYKLIRKYFKSLGVISDYLDEIILESMGILGRLSGDNIFHPTIGGLLLFGKNPMKYLPHCHIKLIEDDITTSVTGNIIVMLDKVSKHFENLLSEYPDTTNALKELVANALIHRDYLDNTNSIEIKISNREIQLSNPGALSAPNGVLKDIKEKFAIRRNPWLYQRLVILDDKERFLKAASGIRTLKEGFSKIGKIKFINETQKNMFKVIINNPKNNKEGS
jgi:predicted HTH transcriptional regulator